MVVCTASATLWKIDPEGFLIQQTYVTSHNLVLVQSHCFDCEMAQFKMACSAVSTGALGVMEV